MPRHATHAARTLRTSPYPIDQLVVTFHRSAAGMAWRWRTELFILTLASAALLRLRYALGDWIRPAALAMTVVLVLAVVPATRRFLARRFWCVLVRHRIHRLCWEARLHTRAGRLPLVLWTRPTKVGERAWLICRAGICAEDFEDRIGELRAACFARDSRITRNLRWSQLVTIDIIRRDTLAATHQIRSPLLNLRLHPAEAATRQASQVPLPELAATGPTHRGAPGDPRG